MNLKVYSHLATKRKINEKDRREFETLEFDPNELKQLKEMNHDELKQLMVFCGIRVFNGIPLLVLEESEMRMAYVVWRSEKIKSCKAKVLPKVERGIQWVEYLQKVINMNL